MKYKLNFSTSDYYRRLQTSVLLLFISLLGFVFLPYVVLDANATDTVNLETQWGKITLELQTGDGGDGSVNFNGGAAITPDATGVVATVAKTLTVNTTGKHFRVYLSMDGTMANQKLCYGFDAADDAKKNCTHTTIGIEPNGSGTPAVLANNTWGYALNDGEAGFSPAGTYYNNKISGEVITATTGKEEDAALYSAKFAAVPVSTAPVKIWSADTNNNNGFGTNSGITGDANNTKEIVYGVKVNSELVAGTYGSKILYTAMASASDFDTPSMNVASSKDLGGPTDVTTLYMDLNTEGISLSANNLTIRLVSHANAKIADGGASGDGKFTASELATAVESAAGTCASVSNLVVTTGGIKVDCTLPDLGAAADGVDYDFIVSVPVVAGGSDALTTNYVSYKKTGTDTGAFRYVGLQTKNGSTPYVTTMQGITTGICKMTNQWGTGVGSAAQLYNRDGQTGGVTVGTAGTGTTSGYGNELGVGTFALKDVRDTKEYLVRRLADGNCWMVQNLDYDLTDSDNLTLLSSTSDVKEDKTLSSKNLSEEIGSNCPAQYQSYDQAGSSCLWGSLKSEDGSQTIPIADGNIARAAFARSYSNTVNGNPRYIPTHQINGTYDSYENSTSGTDNAPATTTGFTPTAIGNSGNAVGYYGNMYIGSYYNWYAATAEAGGYNRTQPDESVCPRGWQLPVGYASGSTTDAGNSAVNLDKSWSKLLRTAYGTTLSFSTEGDNNTTAATNMHRLPLSIPFTGSYYWTNGNLYNRGYYGVFWSSTPYSHTSARNLYFNSSAVWSQIDSGKPYGLPVRCVAR